MKEYITVEFGKAEKSLEAAKHMIYIDPDSAASRAYYAAFHAVTALFAEDNLFFSKHSALRTAIHRDLIKTGLWQPSLGTDFDFLMDLREIGDYGGLTNVSSGDALKAVEAAKRVINAVKTANRKS